MRTGTHPLLLMRLTGGSANACRPAGHGRLNRQKKLEAGIRRGKARVRRAKAKARAAWFRVRDLRAERDEFAPPWLADPRSPPASGRPGTSGLVTMEVGHKRHYNNGEAEFMPRSPVGLVVMVTHRDKVGYFGFNRDWDPAKPYTWAEYEGFVHDDWIEEIGARSYSTPDGALQYLCDLLLTEQLREDARRINPKLVSGGPPGAR